MPTQFELDFSAQAPVEAAHVEPVVEERPLAPARAQEAQARLSLIDTLAYGAALTELVQERYLVALAYHRRQLRHVG